MLTLARLSLRSEWSWDMEFLFNTSGYNKYTIKYSIIVHKEDTTKIYKIKKTTGKFKYAEVLKYELLEIN